MVLLEFDRDNVGGTGMGPGSNGMPSGTDPSDGAYGYTGSDSQAWYDPKFSIAAGPLSPSNDPQEGQGPFRPHVLEDEEPSVRRGNGYLIDPTGRTFIATDPSFQDYGYQGGDYQL